MTALTFPAFGNPEAIRSAAVGNAAYNRAIKLGYSRVSAQNFSRIAKREAGEYESPAHVAMRVVLPKKATFAGPSGSVA